MSSSDLVALAILPSIMWASLVYVTFSSSATASKLRAARNAKTKQELIEGARWWALYGLLIFFTVLASVLAWAKIQQWSGLETTLNPTHWVREIIHGIVLGLALVGMILRFQRFFPQARKFGFLILAGIASRPWARAFTLLLVAFTEELWRAVCLKMLMADGLSGLQASIATSVAYGLAYLPWGIPTAISEGFIGAVFGGIFLRSGSLFVPFAAHLVLRGQHLLFAVAAAPAAEPGEIHQRPHSKCPACGRLLSVREMKLNISEAFFCPSCHTRITFSDQRRAFFRWGSAFVYIALLVASWDIFPRALGDSYAQFLLSVAVASCSVLGLLLIFQVVFPPKLECGDPDIVSLNLGDQGASYTDKNNGSGTQ